MNTQPKLRKSEQSGRLPPLGGFVQQTLKWICELSPWTLQCETETSVLLATGSHTHFSWTLAIIWSSVNVT